MRELWPRPDDDVAVERRLADDARPARADRPWVMVNMITSVDGATALDGVSGPLGGDGDARVFRALRALPDVIVAGAETVRAERYGPARPSDEVRAERMARGQAPVPVVAVVTRSGDLDPTLPLFSGDGPPPLVYVAAEAAQERRRRLAEVAEVVVVEGDGLDLADVLADLARRGAGVVLCEGGPSVNGQLVAADLVDEWHLSVAPRLLAGEAARVAHGPTGPEPVALGLHRVLADDEGYLFVTYRRT